MSNGQFNYPDEIFNVIASPETASPPLLTTITTALSPLYLTQDLNAPAGYQAVVSNQNLIVFGDVVVIDGPLSLPGQTVTIYARQIGTQPDSSNNAAAIDVSGVVGTPPKPPLAATGTGSTGTSASDQNFNLQPGGPGGTGANGQAGQTGNTGGNAGSITVYTESFQSGADLTLTASGGQGGAGQIGQAGGQGGTGGSGGVWGRYCASAGNGGTGGDGGNGGQGGTGGDGGAISVSYVLALTSTTTLTPNYQAGSGGAGGDAGGAGPGGPGGAMPPGGHASCVAGSTGSQGQSNGTQGQNGDDGNDGSYQATQIDYDTLAPYASSSQRLMVLQVAKYMYLSSDPDENPTGYQQTAVLLTWLLNVTDYFNENQTTLPSNPLDLQSGDITQLGGIYLQANSLSYQMSQGLNYFGNSPNYVPMISYATANSVLTTMLQDLETIETTYNTYFTALQTSSATIAQIQAAAGSAETQQTNLADQQTALLATANAQVSAVNADAAGVNNQQVVLLSAIQSFEDAIATLAGENCIITNIIDAVNLMTPLAGEGAKAASTVIQQAGGLLQSDAANLAGVSSLPTDYTVGQIAYLGQNVTSLNEAYTASQNVITSDDPNAYKVLATQTQLNQIVQPYINLASAQSAVTAMNQYVALVQQMNNDILSFNNTVAQIATVAGQIQQVGAQITEAQAQTSNPMQPLLVTYMGRLYEDAKAYSIYQIYLANQALNFWSLDNSFSVYDSLGLDDTGTIDSAVVSTAQGDLLNAWEIAINGYGSDAQTFGGTAPLSGIQYVVNDPDAIQYLQTNQELWFTLPPVMQYTGSLQSPFAGMADVRLTSARPWVQGATTSSTPSDQLIVYLTHTGIETIVSQDGTVSNFTHQPVTVQFQYNYSTNDILEDATLTQPRGAASTSNYALLGPFTLWHLLISPTVNTNLDLSEVTEVIIEFAGQNYTLDELSASLEFNGQGTGYVEVPYSSSLDVGSVLTVSALVYLDPDCGPETAVVASDGYVLSTGAGDYSTGNIYRTLVATFIDTEGNPYEVQGGQIKLQEWTPVAISWQQTGGEIQLFVNGILVASSFTNCSQLNTGSSPVYLGIMTDTQSAPFYGSLSSVALVAGPITSSQYIGVWPLDDGSPNTTVADQSGNGNTGNIVNNDTGTPDVTWGSSPTASE